MRNYRDSILLNGKLYAVKNSAVMAPVFPLEIGPSRLKKNDNSNHSPIKHRSYAVHAKRTHHTARHLKAHVRQRAQTLARHAVKKPSRTVFKPHASRRVLKINPRLQYAHVEIQGITTPARFKRAKTVQKSSLINRFGHAANNGHVIKKTMPIEVKEAPSHYDIGTTAQHSHHKENTHDLDRLIHELSSR